MRLIPALALVVLAAPSLRAASLDVTASEDVKQVSYRNLDLSRDGDNQTYLENNARLGIAAKNIALESHGGEDTTLDLGLVLHAIGVAGSTLPVNSPFDRAAAYYPTTNFTPFIENAYLHVHRLWGEPIDATFGRQNYRLGSGLLLDDDGAGFTGVVVRAELPWEGLKTEAFVFEDKNPQSQTPNSLTLMGFSINLPTEGTWQLNELVERDQSQQLVYGCSYAGDSDPDGCAISKAFRSFTSARYQISYGPLVFDGEAAIEKGVATPTAPEYNPNGTGTPSPNHITYDGNAEVVKVKWKQSFYGSSEGIMRGSVARGTGENASSGTTDDAFYPSHGHRYDGLERSGFGDFYGATPYDAFGGNYSTTTKNGLPAGSSGIVVVGAGFTPPAFHGFMLDVDFFLYQAEQVLSGPRTLGDEWDFRLRYAIRDQFVMSAGFDYFKAGLITDPNQSVARKLSFQASGRF